MGYGYQVVYYDDLESIGSKIATLCDEWEQQLKNIYDAIADFRNSDAIEGKSAVAMKAYLIQVHYPLLTSLIPLVKSLKTNIARYSAEYYNLDHGDGTNNGQRYTTIVASELEKKGAVDGRISRILNNVSSTNKRVFDIYMDVYDLLDKHPRFKEGDELYKALGNAAKIATNLNSLVVYTEGIHTHDFKSIDFLINQCNSIIEGQLGPKRVHAVNYVSGSTKQIIDTQAMLITAQECNIEAENYFNSEEGKAAAEILYGRDARIHEEEKANRRWTKWIATGTAVVVFGAVTIATAGGVGVVGVTVIGAVTGGVSGMTSCLVDNYIETGSPIENLNLGKLVKETTVGAIGGAFTGYTSATAVTSVLKGADKVFDSFMIATTEGAMKEGAKITYDVGECIGGSLTGIITGDYSVLQSKLEQLNEDTRDSFKNIMADGVSAYVGEKVEWKLTDGASKGLFKVKSSFATSSSVFKKGIAEGEKKLIKTSAKESAKQTTTILSDLISGKYLNPENSILKDVQKSHSEIVAKTGSAFISGTSDSIIDAKTEGIKPATKRILIKNAGKKGIDTIVDTAEKVASHYTHNLVSREQQDFSQLWDGELDQGRKPAESFVKNAVKVFCSQEDNDETGKT